MSAGDQGGVAGLLSREQVLAELEFLATVEHALIVDYLSVSCALGYDLDAGEGGATTQQGSDAAATASSLAQGEMSHLKGVNLALVAAGGSAHMGRADSISSASVADTPLGPPSVPQLQQLVARGQAIASAVDERYMRLAPAVTSDPVFDGDLLNQMRLVIAGHGPVHATAFAAIRDSLDGLTPADFLRATRRDPADDFESRLLDISDRSYALTVDALGEQFAQQGVFSPLALSAMESLDAINRVLVQRGLLPPFSPH